MFHSVFPWMNFASRPIIRIVRWVIRGLDSWLDKLDGDCEVHEAHNNPEDESAEPLDNGSAEDEPPIPICPLCDQFMKHKSNKKGGIFFGCPKWPDCRGNRSLTDKKPGPKVLIEKQRELHGDSWNTIEKLKKQEQAPTKGASP